MLGRTCSRRGVTPTPKATALAYKTAREAQLVGEKLPGDLERLKGRPQAGMSRGRAATATRSDSDIDK